MVGIAIVLRGIVEIILKIPSNKSRLGWNHMEEKNVINGALLKGCAWWERTCVESALNDAYYATTFCLWSSVI
jgi:hypothetical protein